MINNFRSLKNIDINQQSTQNVAEWLSLKNLYIYFGPEAGGRSRFKTINIDSHASKPSIKNGYHKQKYSILNTKFQP